MGRPVRSRRVAYAYATGVYSSRQIARRLVEDLAFRVLGAGNFPDFRTIAAFRKRHLQALADLFVQGPQEPALATDPAAETTEAPDPPAPTPGNAAGSAGSRPPEVPPKAQRHFTDPDSRIMRGPGKTWGQAYNGHIACDSAYPVIVHTAVTDQPGDTPNLIPNGARGAGPNGGRSLPVSGRRRVFQR